MSEKRSEITTRIMARGGIRNTETVPDRIGRRPPLESPALFSVIVNTRLLKIKRPFPDANK